MNSYYTVPALPWKTWPLSSGYHTGNFPEVETYGGVYECHQSLRDMKKKQILSMGSTGKQAQGVQQFKKGGEG